jgi:hypothetical protein
MNNPQQNQVQPKTQLKDNQWEVLQQEEVQNKLPHSPVALPSLQAS